MHLVSVCTQVLLLSTVHQLLQSMHASMKQSDIDGLLNCMHSMYMKALATVQACSLAIGWVLE